MTKAAVNLLLKKNRHLPNPIKSEPSNETEIPSKDRAEPGNAVTETYLTNIDHEKDEQAHALTEQEPDQTIPQLITDNITRTDSETDERSKNKSILDQTSLQPTIADREKDEHRLHAADGLLLLQELANFDNVESTDTNKNEQLVPIIAPRDDKLEDNL